MSDYVKSLMAALKELIPLLTGSFILKTFFHLQRYTVSGSTQPILI
jgi:hypothetical protein